MSVNGLLRGPAGKAIGIGLTVVGVVFCWFSWRGMQTDDPSRYRWFVNASNNPPTPFQVEMKAGMIFPIKAPGGGDGYPAETCYWTADGKIKDQPTYVLLNQWIHKAGPTFCPDCGRLVVPHNPDPVAGDPPPPTREEYYARHPMANTAER